MLHDCHCKKHKSSCRQKVCGACPRGPQGRRGVKGVTGGVNPAGLNYSDYLYWDGGEWKVGDQTVHLGSNAGKSSTGVNTVAIGTGAAISGQKDDAVAIGRSAGAVDQEENAIAIGKDGGQSKQSASSIAIGNEAGVDAQGTGAIAIGRLAGDRSQGDSAIAIGTLAGYRGGGPQGVNAIAIGRGAGQQSGESAIAIGDNAGRQSGAGAVAIGVSAGFQSEVNVIAIGSTAGRTSQKTTAIAIGRQSGNQQQGKNAIAIGNFAGNFRQGEESISIGYDAIYGVNSRGQNSITLGANTFSGFPHGANSITINAEGTQPLNPVRANSLYITPIRSDPGVRSLKYNLDTKEITHDAPKNFVIDHPNDPTRYLVHACLEGPESGVYYRGVSQLTDGETWIELPPYVSHLASDLTVQLTQINGQREDRFAGLRAGPVSGQGFAVYGGACHFAWHVEGTRNNIQTEPLRADVRVHGDGPYRYIPKNLIAPL